MSADHGPVTLKPIGEVARHIKKLIPSDIPEGYALKPMFNEIADDETIRCGVTAFRDFLYKLCGYLISDGQLYDKPPTKPKNDLDYPFLQNISNLLIDIGHHGILTDNALFVSEMTEFPLSKGKSQSKFRIPDNCIKFLTLCGLDFSHEADALRVAYPADPLVLTGLKALSVADVKLRANRYRTDASVFLCDYRLLKAEQTDMRDVLSDFLSSLPEDVRAYALTQHQRHVDKGLTCGIIPGTFDTHIFYSNLKNTKRSLTPRDMYYLRMWEFGFSVRHGFCLVVRAKKTGQYSDFVKDFPAHLRDRIARGYGCDRKLYNERCQGGCQGYRFPLDDTLLEIGNEIEFWLDEEVSYAIKR